MCVYECCSVACSYLTWDGAVNGWCVCVCVWLGVCVWGGSVGGWVCRFLSVSVSVLCGSVGVGGCGWV
jgi:hypothetical protein